MYKTEEFDRQQDDSDPDKKMYVIEQRKAQFEKKILWVVLVVFVIGWVFYVQDFVLAEMYNDKGHLHPHYGPPSPLEK